MRAKIENIDAATEKLFDRMFSRRLSGNDNLFKGQDFKMVREDKQLRKHIYELLVMGYDVRTGYTCTKIRGYHDHHVFYKK